MENYNAAFYENLCIYFAMKFNTLNFARYLCVDICAHLFLQNVDVLNANLSNNILFLMSFTFKLSKQKMSSKITSLKHFMFCA